MNGPNADTLASLPVEAQAFLLRRLVAEHVTRDHPGDEADNGLGWCDLCARVKRWHSVVIDERIGE